jgi:hypothetical protein
MPHDDEDEHVFLADASALVHKSSNMKRTLLGFKRKELTVLPDTPRYYHR